MRYPVYVDESSAAALYCCKTESVEFTRWLTTVQALALQRAGYQLVRIPDVDGAAPLAPQWGARQPCL